MSPEVADHSQLLGTLEGNCSQGIESDICFPIGNESCCELEKQEAKQSVCGVKDRE